MPLKLRASIGNAIFDEDGEQLEALIEHSDKAMYKDKRKHKPKIK